MTAPTGQQQLHQHLVQPPPQDDPTTSAAAQILGAAVTVAGAVLAIRALLAPAAVSADAIAAALRLASRGTKHRPRPKGATRRARDQADQELYYRAAYVLRASMRIQADLDRGLTLRQAMRNERRFWEQHQAMRQVRQEAARKEASLASWFGDVLGWYLNPLIANEGECLAANGNNYDVHEGTIIGRPGTVHPNCGCVPGPPWPDGGWVNDAVRSQVRMAGTVRPARRVRKSA